MIKILNVLAILALIGSATAAYSVKYETILMAEKLKKRENERGREQHAIAVLKAEWNLLNRPERLAKLAPPEAGMQVLNVRQIVRAIDIPQAGADVDTIAKALDGTLTGSLATPDSTRKTTGRTPGAPVSVPLSSMPRSPAPPASVARPRASAAPLPLSSASSSPLSLTQRPAPAKAATPPQSASVLAPQRPPARVPGTLPPVPPKSIGAGQTRAGER